jgi:acyl carrier protein
MDVADRQKKVEGLEAIKGKALNMAKEGKDSLEVRDFVTNAKKELAYELPDEEAFQKAKAATLAYKRQAGK